MIKPTITIITIPLMVIITKIMTMMTVTVLLIKNKFSKPKTLLFINFTHRIAAINEEIG